MSEAWNLWDKVWANDRIAFLPEPDGLEKKFRKHSRLSSRSPKVWADAYLLASASIAGIKLVTFDRALESRGARARRRGPKIMNTSEARAAGSV